MTEPPEVTEIRDLIRRQKGAWALGMALEAETAEGGSMWDEHGYCNGSLALSFIHILQRCPAQARLACPDLLIIDDLPPRRIQGQKADRIIVDEPVQAPEPICDKCGLPVPYLAEWQEIVDGKVTRGHRECMSQVATFQGTPTITFERELLDHGFAWIGQGWEGCERCGRPAREHPGMALPKPGRSPFDMAEDIVDWEEAVRRVPLAGAYGLLEAVGRD